MKSQLGYIKREPSRCLTDGALLCVKEEDLWGHLCIDKAMSKINRTQSKLLKYKLTRKVLKQVMNLKC